MTCPKCSKPVSHWITGSAFGGPLHDTDDRPAVTYYPCKCTVDLQAHTADAPNRRRARGR